MGKGRGWGGGFCSEKTGGEGYWRRIEKERRGEVYEGKREREVEEKRIM